MSCSLWGCKELDTSEHRHTHTQKVIIYELRWFLEFKKEKRGQRLNERVCETKEIEKKAAV